MRGEPPAILEEMSSFGVVVIAVLVVGIVVGVVLARRPVPWEELGGGGLDSGDEAAPASAPPSRAADEADLRALLDRKRAARRARGAETGMPERPIAQGPPWAHMESDVIEEARALVARRRARLAREGQDDIDEHAELERILGPPHV